mmetsp:Transcript_60340/g.127804  ORF Transcript_60340/g.127804 Transcript_60340/m.127804 type:complete len:304 (-) Transcript_60340:978-1889(-)
MEQVQCRSLVLQLLAVRLGRGKGLLCLLDLCRPFRDDVIGDSQAGLGLAHQLLHCLHLAQETLRGREAGLQQLLEKGLLLALALRSLHFGLQVLRDLGHVALSSLLCLALDLGQLLLLCLQVGFRRFAGLDQALQPLDLGIQLVDLLLVAHLQWQHCNAHSASRLSLGLHIGVGLLHLCQLCFGFQQLCLPFLLLLHGLLCCFTSSCKLDLLLEAVVLLLEVCDQLSRRIQLLLHLHWHLLRIVCKSKCAQGITIVDVSWRQGCNHHCDGSATQTFSQQLGELVAIVHTLSFAERLQHLTKHS